MDQFQRGARVGAATAGAPPSRPLGVPLVFVAIVSASLIGSASLGARQTFGLFIEPLSSEYGFPITTVAFAIAVHNLVWGLAQPFAGAAADRYGAGPIVAVGALLLTAGLALTAAATSVVMLIVGFGALVGIGISCTTFGVLLTAVGRTVEPERRSTAMGLASAGGSLGQVLLVPYAQFAVETWGAAAALLGLAALVLAVSPLGYGMGRPAPLQQTGQDDAHPSTTSAVLQALGHHGYCLLTLGFFTCGFQLAFIATHLPNYLSFSEVSSATGATALAVIGLFNMLGSWGCGWLGGRFRPRNVLALLYLIRGLVIALFLVTPKTDAGVIVFAAVMGLMWLGTVPLTTGIVATIFGTRHLGTLFGLCFLSHQIGSFLGSWLGGFILQETGSYTLIWVATSAAGFVAAALHLAVRDTPAHPQRAAQ